MIEYYPADTGAQTPGTISAANEARFTAGNYSEALTAYTAGWRDGENLRALLDFIAPPVPVARRFEFKKALNSEAFLSETDDVRAVGAPFKRVEYGGETVNEKTLNKGLTVRVDHDDALGDDWQERHVGRLMQRLLRNEIRRALAALAAVATSEDVTWDASANPDADLRLALSLGTDAGGVRPNRLLFGEGAWDLRAAAYEAQTAPAAGRAAGLLPEELARKLFVDGARVVSARYQETATAKAAVLGNTVYLYRAQDGLMKDEPSNIKRFVTPAEGGLFRVYVEPSAKFTDLTVEHYSNVVITSSLGVRALAVSDGA